MASPAQRVLARTRHLGARASRRVHAWRETPDAPSAASTHARIEGTWRAYATHIAFGLALAMLASCNEPKKEALGTLEYDRIAMPATAAERVIEIDVREGERVKGGQLLLRLDPTHTRASFEAARAEAERLRNTLAELVAGPRKEDIAQARAQLNAAEAQARDARVNYARIAKLGRDGAVAQMDVDRALAATQSADAQVHAAEARLLELQRGTRSEQIAQGEAALMSAEANAAAQAVTLEKLTVIAPRAGLVDSLPYRVGDQPPVGAPVAILLVGDHPYARVYVPEPIRADVRVGQSARVIVPGREKPFAARVRMIESEPSFTPYYALSGGDAARLSYLAEVELTDRDASELPAGIPVRVELAGAEERRG